MNHQKMLSTAILLILTKSALGIEFEPNNDSNTASKLGTENVGKLNRASDVDFFLIDSCVKNDKKECVKYTAADEKLNSLNKAGMVKRREEISLSFACNSRSATGTGGWFLGIHDSNGELQETYPVKPEDCMITETNKEAFSFKFPVKPEISNYYVSVVADCQAPTYNTAFDPKNPEKTIINVNKFFTMSLATAEEIKSLKNDLLRIKDVIANVKKDLSKTAVINSNANVQQLSDAFALVSSIASLASEKLTPETNITAANSVASAIEIAGFAMQVSIVTWQNFLIAEAAERKASIQIKLNESAANEAKTELDKKTSALETANTKLEDAKIALIAAKKTLSEAESALKNATADKKADAQTARDNAAAAKIAAEDTKQAAEGAINSAEFAKNAAEESKNATDRAKLETDQIVQDKINAKADDDDAKSKVTEALTAVSKAVEFLNKTVQDNINAANTAANLSKHFDSACKDNYNVGIYTLTDKFDNSTNPTKTVEDISLKSQINLGLQQSGQIKSITDNNVYLVESDGSSDIPFVFTCSAMAARQSNNWKLSIFNDANVLINSALINGSTCGSVFVGDKGGYSFKLPKGSQSYYLAVESACASSTKKDCVVDTSEYSILRDVDKVYSGKLTGKKIDAKSADLKLTNCGLNNNSTISVKAENVNLTEAAKLAKLPVNVQIGSMACRFLKPDLSTKDTIIGSVAQASTIIDSIEKAKDHANIILNDCGSHANAKVTLTGSKLDLVNLTPGDSGVVPIKVSIGDFQCGTNGDVFTINNATAETIYSIATLENGDVFASLESAKNIGDSQTNQIKTIGDLQTYFVESLTPANFEFSCPNSKRFTNDWILLTYDSTKKLQSTKTINGSDCGTGKAGDTGTLKFSALSNSPRTYFVVKSACEKGDRVCKVDTSKYTISRSIPDSAICFSGVCDTNLSDAPIFGGN